jgi:hypothetical protein
LPSAKALPGKFSALRALALERAKEPATIPAASPKIMRERIGKASFNDNAHAIVRLINVASR